MIQPIQKIAQYFDGENRVIGYFHPGSSKNILAGDHDAILEMIVNVLNKLIAEVNNATATQK